MNSTKPFLRFSLLQLLLSVILLLPLQADTQSTDKSSEKKEKPYASSIQKREQQQEEQPVRVRLSYPESRRVQVQWGLVEPTEIKYYLIQHGQVSRADDEEIEYQWQNLRVLQGEITQWTVPAPEQSSAQQYLRIVAVKKNDKALFSAPVLFNAAPAIPAPSLVRLQADRVETRSIQISWSPPVSSANSGAVIERARSSSGPWQQVGQVAQGGRIYQDRFLEPDTEYHYRVRSLQGASNWQSDVLRIRTPR